MPCLSYSVIVDNCILALMIPELFGKTLSLIYIPSKSKLLTTCLDKKCILLSTQHTLVAKKYFQPFGRPWSTKINNCT